MMRVAYKHNNGYHSRVVMAGLFRRAIRTYIYLMDNDYDRLNRPKNEQNDL